MSSQGQRCQHWNSPAEVQPPDCSTVPFHQATFCPVYLFLKSYYLYLFTLTLHQPGFAHDFVRSATVSSSFLGGNFTTPSTE